MEIVEYHSNREFNLNLIHGQVEKCFLNTKR